MFLGWVLAFWGSKLKIKMLLNRERRPKENGFTDCRRLWSAELLQTERQHVVMGHRAVLWVCWGSSCWNGAPTWLSAPRQTAGWGEGLSPHGWRAVSLLTVRAVHFCTCKRLIMSSTSWQLTSCMKIATSQVPQEVSCFSLQTIHFPLDQEWI